MPNASYTISSIIFTILLAFIFFSKKRINHPENKLFSIIIVITLIGILSELINYFLVIHCISETHWVYILSSKLILIYYAIWGTLFAKYVNLISSKQWLNKIYNILLFFVVFIIMLIPLQFNHINNLRIPQGMSVMVVYGLTGIYIIASLAISSFSLKRENIKKYIPLLGFILIGAITMSIQLIKPEMLMMSFLHCLILYLMYFTIENPDVQMLNEVTLAKEQAEHANKAKTDFLSSMSHEIRTPLNAIVGFSQVIEQADTLEEAKENAKDIVEASNTLLEIVNGILDISKIEAGKLELVLKDYDPYELFESASKLIELKMKDKGLDFQVNIAKDIPRVLYGDPANIKKIIVNLLSNAYKYTDKGIVKYNVSSVINKDICRLMISVEDTGRGIKKENIDKLFTKFQRLDEDRNTTIEGTGLGLAITKQLVEMMGGKIVCQSVYGSGSKFTIALDQKITSMIEIKPKKMVTTTRASSGFKNKKILIVDDNNLNIKVAERLLKQFEVNITSVDSGFACLEKINNGEKFDLILMDDMMPKLSGTETLERLKNINGFVTPTIALTANAISGMREQYIEKGFNDYLAKPIEKEELLRVFNEYLITSKEDEKIDFGSLPNDIFKINEEEVKDLVIDANKEEKLEEVKEIREANLTINKEIYDLNYLTNNQIDIKCGLELLGDETTYKETMLDFYKNIKNKVLELNQYLEKKDMSNYAILVHSLKSDSKYLGFTHLADLALDHEMKSKENDYEYIKNNYYLLIDEIKRIIVIIKKYLNK